MEYLIQVRHPEDRLDLEEAVDRLLWLSGCSGSSTEDVGGEVTVSLYYPDRLSREAGLERISRVDGLDAMPVDRADTDWLAHYKQSLEPIIVGSRFVVAPDATLVPVTDRMSIIVPQERAFGTGSHETTSLCLEAMEEIDIEGKLVMDVGTGSGILAIGAAKLGARRVIAFDNDLEGWGVVQRNVERNRVEQGRVVHFFGTISALAACRFDVVTMNIIPEIILPMVDSVVDCIVPGGAVVLSGILQERRDDILGVAGSMGLALISERTRGEWWACTLRR